MLVGFYPILCNRMLYVSIYFFRQENSTKPQIMENQIQNLDDVDFLHVEELLKLIANGSNEPQNEVFTDLSMQ